jgi:NADH dehydrogenase
MDVLVHCAYMTRFTDLNEAKRVNEEGTVKLLECAREEGVGCFVFVSSNSARGDAPSYYAKSKHNLEQIMDPLRDLVLRPGLILAANGGLFFRISKLVKRLPVLPVFSGGRQKIKTVHVDDLCEVFVKSVQSNAHGAFTVTEPDGVTMRRLLRLMAAKLQRRRLILPLPATPFLIVLRLFESLGIKLPVSSENLLGLLALPDERSRSQVEPFGVRIRTAEQSISDLVDSLRVA